MPFLDKNLVALGVEVESPEEAIVCVGNLLLKEGYVNRNYIKAMVNSYDKNGAYFVIAPKIAIPHARPEDGAKRSAISLAVLKKTIEFGHSKNDPVKLVFGLAASTSKEHLGMIQQISKLLMKKENIEKISQAKDYSDIKKLKEGLE